MKNLLLIMFVFSLLLLINCSESSKINNTIAGSTSGKENLSLDNNKSYKEAVKRREEKILEAEKIINKEKMDKIIKAKQTEKRKKMLFEKAKTECEEIGFKKGTEKFGECVLDLTE